MLTALVAATVLALPGGTVDAEVTPVDPVKLVVGLPEVPDRPDGNRCINCW